MKKPLLLCLLLASAGASAHGHWPQVMSKYVASEDVEVTFTLGNYFKKRTCFDIEVNGEIMSPMRECLAPDSTKKISVWVKTPADHVTENQVCSVANTPGMLRTRMCTISTTLYPRAQLLNVPE